MLRKVPTWDERAGVSSGRRILGLIACLACAACVVTGVLAGTAPGHAWAAESGTALAATDVAPAASTVDLWKVTASGGVGGTIGVGDVVVATAYKRSTYGAVSEDDEVAYQWQYANTSTTQDAYFTDIEGATSATYTISADMLGKYLRVKAMGQNTVVSTSNPYGGTTLPVSPLGPVQEAAGAVTLESVSLVSSLANSMWVGAVVTPTAQYLPQGSYVPTPVPQDAAVTYTWKVSDSTSGPFEPFDATAYPQSSVTNSGELVIGADLTGKYVRVEANALVNTKSSLTWQVLPQGLYDLLRITFGFDNLYSGGTIYTTLQGKTLAYENEASFGTTVPPDDPNTSYQWYSTEDEPDANAEWAPIEGATQADLVIPESIIGSYVKVVATSSKEGFSSSVERASTSRVLAGGGMQQLLEKLEFYHPYPKWKTATNLNDVVSEKLASMGYEDVAVKTTSFTRSSNDEKAHLDVSTADDETNGDVQFFTYDGAAQSSYHNFSVHHQVTVTFEFTRAGEDPVEFTATTNIPWDLDAAQAIIDDQMDGFAVSYAQDDSAESVTQDVTLPCKAGILWATWASSNEEVLKIYRDESSAGALWDPYTGIVTRGSEDAPVTLTATVKAGMVDSSDESLDALDQTIECPIVVKGDADLIAAMNAELAGVIDAGFTYDAVTVSATGAAIDPDDITADLQLPTARTLFSGSSLSSGDYRVSYSSDDESAMKVNGYRAVAMRPLPGAPAADIALTVTVSHKTKPAVSYAKSLALKVTPLVEAEIDEDIAFMEQVKDSLFAGYSEGAQEQDAVTSDLHPFQRAYFTDDGQLHWKYSYDDTADANCTCGFTPQTVADTTSSDASYERFVSSHPGIIADGTLRVNRATRDIGVSITCCLTSDRFGAYYERYKADATCPEALKEKFSQLYRQKVGCLITVKGTQVAAAAREELLAEAADADALAASAVVSEDGSDVAQDAQWVDSATMATLQDAIVYARAIAAKDAATDTEVAAASEQLQQACAAFEAAKRDGSCAYASAEQKEALKAVADAAEALLDTVYSSADGSDVAVGRQWASEELVDRLADAIASVRVLMQAPNASEADLTAAVGELALARAALENGIQSGTLGASAQAAKVQVGASYVAGSGASKATYLVKKVASGKSQGVVWYRSSKVAKTAKAATVPATVTIKGGSYKVVRVCRGAFANLKKLAKVTLGKNVAKVEKGSFTKTPKLKRLVVKSAALKKAASVKGALAGSKAGKLTVKVPKKIKKAAKKAFSKKNLAAPKAVKVK